jgi:OOP family OmpA-OmpF porin
MIELKGYASASGRAALNQKMSQERASNVTNILVQQAHIPLTKMLAPGAMGESAVQRTTGHGSYESSRGGPDTSE